MFKCASSAFFKVTNNDALGFSNLQASPSVCPSILTHSAGPMLSTLLTLLFGRGRTDHRAPPLQLPRGPGQLPRAILRPNEGPGFEALRAFEPGAWELPGFLWPR